VVVSLFGAQFITWRGIPIIPSDKVPLEKSKTKFIWCAPVRSAKAS